MLHRICTCRRSDPLLTPSYTLAYCAFYTELFLSARQAVIVFEKTARETSLASTRQPVIMSQRDSHHGVEPSIPSLVEELRGLVTDGFDSESSAFTSVQARAKLVQLTTQLGVLARDPAENIYYLMCRTAQSSAIRTAIGLRVFELVPAGAAEAASVRQLASAAGADPLLTERLMRVLASCGIFKLVDDDVDGGANDRYAHNALSRCFLNKHNRDLFHQAYDFIGKGVYAMPEWLEARGWRGPEGYEGAPASVALGHPGGFWDYLAASPERQALFDSGMQSRHRGIDISALYPFDRELDGAVDGAGDAGAGVTLVDVGGGRGQTLKQIKEAFPGIRGRLILQDQDAVIREAQANGLPDYIEAQVASFFEPNPVANARAYLFRRVLHDWADPLSVKVLSNTVAAMGAHSKILIADMEMPVRDTPWLAALSDWSMMALGGIERTERQWEALLSRVGLRVVKVWRAPGSYHVVIEGRKVA